MGYMRATKGTDKELAREWLFYLTLMEYRGGFQGIVRVRIQSIYTVNLSAVEAIRDHC